MRAARSAASCHSSRQHQPTFSSHTFSSLRSATHGGGRPKRPPHRPCATTTACARSREHDRFVLLPRDLLCLGHPEVGIASRTSFLQAATPLLTCTQTDTAMNPLQHRWQAGRQWFAVALAWLLLLLLAAAAAGVPLLGPALTSSSSAWIRAASICSSAVSGFLARGAPAAPPFEPSLPRSSSPYEQRGVGGGSAGWCDAVGMLVDEPAGTVARCRSTSTRHRHPRCDSPLHVQLIGQK